MSRTMLGISRPYRKSWHLGSQTVNRPPGVVKDDDIRLAEEE